MQCKCSVWCQPRDNGMSDMAVELLCIIRTAVPCLLFVIMWVNFNLLTWPLSGPSIKLWPLRIGIVTRKAVIPDEERVLHLVQDYVTSSVLPPPPWRCDPTRVMTSSFLRFLDHTQRRITVGRTSLDAWSARCRDLWQHTTLTRGGLPSLRWDSNPQSQQASGRTSTP